MNSFFLFLSKFEAFYFKKPKVYCVYHKHKEIVDHSYDTYKKIKWEELRLNYQTEDNKLANFMLDIKNIVNPVK